MSNNEIQVTESLHLKRVVAHDPPIVCRPTNGAFPFQIEETVYWATVYRDGVVPGKAPHIGSRHSGHNLKKDGTLGAERRDLYGLALSEDDKSRLSGLRATTAERFKDEIHRRWGHGS